jgi:hypothetical protein
MITVGIFIKDSVTSEYNRLELFSDEKISVNSSIQNVNDISKTFTDFSQTFTVPASKQNNKIFRHWYENSNDNGFSTLVKADAYIEIDTILFRSGKIQLESANVKDGQPQDYSITFIGALGSLKDKFNGLFLKDLTDETYTFAYTGPIVLSKITNTTSTDIMFPLISSDRYWLYGGSGLNNINDATKPIYYNELFPALRLKPILNMIETQFGINFDGTTTEPSTFLSDARFTNAYLWLKNSETFNPLFFGKPFISSAVTYDTENEISTFDVSTNTMNYVNPEPFANEGPMTADCLFTARTGPSAIGKKYWFEIFYNGKRILILSDIIASGGGGSYGFISANALPTKGGNIDINSKNGEYTYKLSCEIDINLTNLTFEYESRYTDGGSPVIYESFSVTIPNYTYLAKINIGSIMPEIKIEDFFSGLLKMFNLTCYSKDGINYTIRQIEEYYLNSNTIDITKYIKSDSNNLNRIKTYKKINFEYEKSQSLVNVGFNSANGIEYGSLFYDTTNDGDEYNIKLPFEDLNFNNLKDKLQVGYALKTDLQKYIPKPVILYDYNPTDTTDLTSTNFYFSTNLVGSGASFNTYKAFGQEYTNGTDTYSLNFGLQQSTLTNDLIDKGLYDQYYSNYITNIFDSKARLIKVSGILPTSLLTTLKLNDRLIIRDKRYLINTMTTDLTTGEVQFELLTDNRTL